MASPLSRPDRQHRTAIAPHIVQSASPRAEPLQHAGLSRRSRAQHWTQRVTQLRRQPISTTQAAHTSTSAREKNDELRLSMQDGVDTQGEGRMQALEPNEAQGTEPHEYVSQMQKMPAIAALWFVPRGFSNSRAQPRSTPRTTLPPRSSRCAVRQSSAFLDNSPRCCRCHTHVP